MEARCGNSEENPKYKLHELLHRLCRPDDLLYEKMADYTTTRQLQNLGFISTVHLKGLEFCRLKTFTGQLQSTIKRAKSSAALVALEYLAGEHGVHAVSSEGSRAEDSISTATGADSGHYDDGFSSDAMPVTRLCAEDVNCRYSDCRKNHTVLRGRLCWHGIECRRCPDTCTFRHPSAWYQGFPDAFPDAFPDSSLTPDVRNGALPEEADAKLLTMPSLDDLMLSCMETNLDQSGSDSGTDDAKAYSKSDRKCEILVAAIRGNLREMDYEGPLEQFFSKYGEIDRIIRHDSKSARIKFKHAADAKALLRLGSLHTERQTLRISAPGAPGPLGAICNRPWSQSGGRCLPPALKEDFRSYSRDELLLLRAATQSSDFHGPDLCSPPVTAMPCSLLPLLLRPGRCGPRSRSNPPPRVARASGPRLSSVCGGASVPEASASAEGIDSFFVTVVNRWGRRSELKMQLQ